MSESENIQMSVTLHETITIGRCANTENYEEIEFVLKNLEQMLSDPPKTANDFNLSSIQNHLDKERRKNWTNWVQKIQKLKDSDLDEANKVMNELLSDLEDFAIQNAAID